MAVQVVRESEIMQEAFDILLKQMSPSKFSRFWTNWQAGQGDYLQWRDAEFTSETVDDLYQKMVAFQENRRTDVIES